MHTYVYLISAFFVFSIGAAGLANLTTTRCADTLQDRCCRQAFGVTLQSYEAARSFLPLLVVSGVSDHGCLVGLSCEPVGTKDIYQAVCCDI